MARRGYSDGASLLHRILHQKVRNVEKLRGKIRPFVLVDHGLVRQLPRQCASLSMLELDVGPLD